MLAVPDPASLAALPLFAGLPPAQLARLGELVRPVRLPAGAQLIAAEEPGAAAYVIVAGTVKVQLVGADGAEVLLTVQAGGYCVYVQATGNERHSIDGNLVNPVGGWFRLTNNVCNGGWISNRYWSHDFSFSYDGMKFRLCRVRPLRDDCGKALSIWTDAGAFSSVGGDPSGPDLPELALHNQSSGQVALWAMNGLSVAAGPTVANIPGADWRLAGRTDYDGDGRADLVLQSRSSGQIVVWLLSGLNVSRSVFVANNPGADWQVLGVADLNGDGQPDFALQHRATQQVAVWYMGADGVNVGGGGVVSTPPAGYRLVGVADYNNDGQTDLVFQHEATMRIGFWYLSGMNIVGNPEVANTPGAGWKVAAVTDYNGDGQVDIVLHNRSTGRAAVWYMGGLNVGGGGDIANPVSAGWLVVAAR